MEGSAPSGVEDREPTSPVESEKPQEEAEEEEQVVESSSSGDDSPSMEMVQTFFQYPVNWELAGLSSPEQAEDQNDEVQAEAEEEDTNQAAGEVAEELESNGGDSEDSTQVDLFFHQMEMAMNESAESTGHESTSATVTVDHGTGASSSNNTGSVCMIYPTLSGQMRTGRSGLTFFAVPGKTRARKGDWRCSAASST